MRHRLITKPARACALALLITAGCTSIQVQPIDPSLAPKYICIRENPAVQVADFVPVIRARLSSHDIRTDVFSSAVPAGCQYVLTYTALRSWDLVPFLSHAEVYLSHNGRQVATGTFHLRGKGGYALTKYDSTEKKMDPVIDQLIGAAPTGGNAQ